MSFKTLLGIISALAIFAISAVQAIADPSVLLDPSSLLIVCGGTLAATLVSFPLESFANVMRVFLRNVLRKNAPPFGEIIRDVTALSRARMQGESAFEAQIRKVRHPFLREGAELLFWSDANIDAAELRDLLETSLDTHYREYSHKSAVFQTVGKYPPAFGMMGTTIGMIALLQTLGGDKGIERIGPGMAVALITTLLGIAISNLILIPIAENLMSQTREDAIARRMIVEGLMLILGRMPSKYVEEKMKFFLLPSVRDQVLKASG